MPGGYKNIKGTDGNTWKKGQSGNPKGRQRKHYKQHIDSVKNKSDIKNCSLCALVCLSAGT